MTMATWADAFKKETVDIARMDIHALTYEQSADRMRTLLKTGTHALTAV